MRDISTSYPQETPTHAAKPPAAAEKINDEYIVLFVVNDRRLVGGLQSCSEDRGINIENRRILEVESVGVKDLRGEILLVPVGKAPPEVFGWLGDQLPLIFGCSCRVVPGLPNPTFAWNERRRQYHGGAILAQIRTGRAACALAVADLDLFVPELNFIFGLADQGSTRAMIAIARLRQSFYGLQDDTNLFRQRVIKEAVHELGHVWGLEHCSKRSCVMAFSNSLADTDYKGHALCPRCRAQMQVRTGGRQ